MDRDYWYDQDEFQKQMTMAQEHAQNNKSKKEKKFGVATLIACMLITSLLGGVVGSILQQGATKPVELNGNQQAQVDASGSSNNNGQTPSNINLAVQNNTQEGSYTEAQVVELCGPSIVGIDVEGTTNWYGQQQIVQGSGSGIIISEDGYIITNNHVINGANKIKVYLLDDTEYEARLIATDEKSDLAVIKIEATGLTPAVMGDSDQLAVGERVVAIGNPLGELRGTATGGMVSALSRTIVIENQEMTLLQTDAAINPGNSGGGLFNSKGQVIGVINAKVASSDTEGLGFAIPINIAKGIVDDLMNQGYVGGRAYLGVYTQQVLLRSNSIDGRNGNDSFFDYFFGNGGGMQPQETRVMVQEIVLNSAAQQAGIQAGDLILAVGDKEITTNDELTAAIGEYKAGDVATIKVQRDNQELELQVTFGEFIPEQ